MQPEVDIQARHIKMSYHYGKSECEIICKIPADLESLYVGRLNLKSQNKSNTKKKKRERGKERKEEKKRPLREKNSGQ